MKGSNMQMRATVQRWRKRSTALVTLAWLLAALMTGSRWGMGDPIGVTLFAMGCLLVGIGVIGRVWCLAFIAGDKSEKLVVDGPYSLCRNPLYFFSLVGAIGVGLGTCTLTFPFLVILGFGLYYPWVMKSESRRLAQIHGSAFLGYRQSTWAFLPRPGYIHEPRERTIQSQAFRRGVFDCIWFFVAFALIHACYELHQNGLEYVMWVLP